MKKHSGSDREFFQDFADTATTKIPMDSVIFNLVHGLNEEDQVLGVLPCSSRSHKCSNDKEELKFHLTKSPWAVKTTLIDCYTYNPTGTSPVGRSGGVMAKGYQLLLQKIMLQNSDQDPC